MAHSSECRDRYAQKVLDTADIVRDAIYQQRWLSEVNRVAKGVYQHEKGKTALLGDVRANTSLALHLEIIHDI